mmetsp:Transcript_11434/g.53187  ORF Transcript_11434/g.53187 Transcript_11434/m.53187 type:complete len:202 (-) Transcript_11434:192-797(-)
MAASGVSAKTFNSGSLESSTKEFATFATCSHRVALGARINAPSRPVVPFVCPHVRRLENTGRRYESVFPDPVSAATTQSRIVSEAVGTARVCSGVARSNPRRVKAATTSWWSAGVRSAKSTDVSSVASTTLPNGGDASSSSGLAAAAVARRRAPRNGNDVARNDDDGDGARSRVASAVTARRRDAPAESGMATTRSTRTRR